MSDAVRASDHTEPEDVSDETVEGVGRNVLDGRWTFQVVEEFDDTYYELFRGIERESRELTGGIRHVLEARMKQQRQTERHPEHTLDPGE